MGDNNFKNNVALGHQATHFICSPDSVHHSVLGPDIRWLRVYVTVQFVQPNWHNALELNYHLTRSSNFKYNICQNQANKSQPPFVVESSNDLHNYLFQIVTVERRALCFLVFQLCFRETNLWATLDGRIIHHALLFLNTLVILKLVLFLRNLQTHRFTNVETTYLF